MQKETKISRTLKNIMYSLGANIISTILGMVFTLWIPKYIGVNEYGYYQLYILYLTYSYILAWGWWDGIYLEIGGKFYQDLDKESLRRQFQLIAIYSTILYAVIFVIMLFFTQTPEKRLIYGFVCITATINAMRLYLQYIIQATNCMKEYSMTIITWRLIACVGGIVLVLFFHANYILLILMDCLGRFVSFLYEIEKCRDIVFGKIGNLRLAAKEGVHAIRRGYKLMIATMTGNLIIGLVRLEIENHWDISEFAKVTLVISLTNVFISCVNAISVALFPALRRIKMNQLAKYYSMADELMTVFLFGVLICCYPLMKIAGWWLPQYADSMIYVPFLLPICIFEGKNSVLGTTYLKILNKETELMKLNIISVVLTAALSYFSVYIYDSIPLAMLTVVLVMGVRCTLSEKLVCVQLKTDNNKIIMYEIIMIAVFLVSHIMIGTWRGTILYSFVYGVIVVFSLKKIKQFVKEYRKGKM